MTIAVTSFAQALLATLVMGRDAPPLADLRWERRPILVFAEAGDPRLERQMSLFRAAEDDLEARDNVVIVDTEPGSPLRARFEPDGFTVILVGKDGGEKARHGRIVDPDEFADLIDTMPMRQREIRRRSSQD